MNSPSSWELSIMIPFSSKLGRLAGLSKIACFPAFSKSAVAVGNKLKMARAILPTLNPSDCTLYRLSPWTMRGYECRYCSCADTDKDISALGLEMKCAFLKSVITGFQSFPRFTSEILFDFKLLGKMSLLWTWLRASMIPLKMWSQHGLSSSTLFMALQRVFRGYKVSVGMANKRH